MHTPPRIRFQGMDASPALEERVREEIAALARHDPAVGRCDVTIIAPHHHHKHGNLYEVHVELFAHGADLIVNREPGQNHAREDPFVAVRDAFDAARRRLRKEAEKAKDHDGRSVRRSR